MFCSWETCDLNGTQKKPEGQVISRYARRREGQHVSRDDTVVSREGSNLLLSVRITG